MARKKKEDEVVEPVLSVDVETPNGVVKNVNGTDAEEVAQGVAAVKNDPVVVQPDINNPAHGNKTLAEMQELDQD